MFNHSNLKWVIVGVTLVVFVITFFLIRRPGLGTPSTDEGANPRPDVLAWIGKHYGQDQKKKVALTRLAEVDQYILTHPDEAMEAERRDSLALACYEFAFPSTKEKIDGLPPYEALSAQSFNTYVRARKRIAYNGKLSGHVFESSPNIDSWEKQCETPLSP